MVPRSAAFRYRATRWVRHGHRTVRSLDVRLGTRTRDYPVSTDALPHTSLGFSHAAVPDHDTRCTARFGSEPAGSGYGTLGAAPCGTECEAGITRLSGSGSG